MWTHCASFGLSHFETEVDDVDEPAINYGMAPDSLVEKIAAVFQNKISIDFEKKQTFSTTDTDIYLYLPPWDRVFPEEPKDEKSLERLCIENWLGSAPSRLNERRHFISMHGNRAKGSATSGLREDLENHTPCRQAQKCSGIFVSMNKRLKRFITLRLVSNCVNRACWKEKRSTSKTQQRFVYGPFTGTTRVPA